MHPRVKNVIFFFLLAFIIYAVVKSPKESAESFSAFWSVITNAASGIGTFFKQLIG